MKMQERRKQKCSTCHGTTEPRLRADTYERSGNINERIRKIADRRNIDTGRYFIPFCIHS